MSREIKKTDRGFSVYLDMEDTYEANVMVMQSSADPLDKVWVFIGGGALTENSENDGAAHLSREHAAALSEALIAWLADQNDMDRDS